MSEQWFVNQNGKTLGPFSATQLRGLAAQGRVSPTTQIANSKNGPWYPATKVKGLIPTPPAPVPQLASQPPQVVFVSPPIAAPNQPPQLGESILWSGRPSQIANLESFIMSGLFFWLIVPLFVALWRYLEIRFITYEVTTERFRITHGVLSRRTDELELYRVKDTSFVQPLFLRLFGLANVAMATSDISTPFAGIRGIPTAEARQLREMIRTHVEKMRDRKRVREVELA